jgi:hypothetical protein
MKILRILLCVLILALLVFGQPGPGQSNFPTPPAVTVVSTSGSPYLMAGKSGYYWQNTASAFQWNLDKPTPGKQYCFGSYSGQSGVLTIKSTTGVYIVYEGANGTVSTGTLVSGGALGDFICLIGVDSMHYNAAGAGFGSWSNN